jgi:hypothetical protein
MGICKIVSNFGPLTGLVLNLIGTLLVSCAFGKNRGSVTQGQTYLAAMLHPWWFQWGIGLLFLGFSIQALSEIIKMMFM